ncbi:hypothetical protein AArcSl_2443 [Halalkaliarchaeum desulfuricum]|uniref:Uncharacterized protein n=1 Tax=Halalkaliarchaeum desulfuricum TaxID=2055893 RepID=A0A343TLU3_9EURY|nr:hypothetical protein [Halalkaliarchaeum desulfuricum]AUX10065.1 hypothetical protein AArcSl_2443 [Halalkaliarchaeum desulfuricum]
MRRRTVLAGAFSIVAGLTPTGCLGSRPLEESLSAPTEPFEFSYYPCIDGEPLEYADHAPEWDGPPLDSSDEPSRPPARGPDVGQGVPVAIPVPIGEHDDVGVVVADAEDPDDSAY